MKLLTKEVIESLPPLYSQDGKGMEAIAYVKFFTPDSTWTWYATEGESIDAGPDPRQGDFRFFGLVQGMETELGYFHLSELESARGPLGLKIERDLYFKPCKLNEIRR
jgi:hypothetical protein